MDIRAVVEGQFLSMLIHSQSIGIKTNQILATGGASKNKHIVQIMADVFGVKIYTHSQVRKIGPELSNIFSPIVRVLVQLIEHSMGSSLDKILFPLTSW